MRRSRYSTSEVTTIWRYTNVYIIIIIIIICRYHHNVPQFLCHSVTPGLPVSSGSYFAILWEPRHGAYVSNLFWKLRTKQLNCPFAETTVSFFV